MAQYVRNTLQGAGLTEGRVPTAPVGSLYDPSPGANQYQSPAALARRPQYTSAIQDILNVNKTRTLRTQALADFAAREAQRQQAANAAKQFQQWASGLGGTLAGQPFTGGRGSSGGGGNAPAYGRAGVFNLAKQAAGSYGWGNAAQLNALYTLGMHESGWNPNAQNPTSTAYGVGQFLDSTWGTVGGRKTSDPAAQVQYMLKYIAQRYGSPVNAWSFWQRNHWY